MVNLLHAIYDKLSPTNETKQIMKNLIKCGEDVNEIYTTDPCNLTMLSHSLLEEKYEWMHLLLDIGASLDIGQTRCATLVCIYDDSSLLELFIQKGIDLSHIDERGNSYFSVCCEFGSVECAKVLAKHGLYSDDILPNGYTYLIEAAKNGKIEMVKFLLELGADVNQAIDEDITTIIYSIMNDDVPITKLLIDHGASVEPRGKNGYMNIIEKAMRGENKEMFETVLQAKADLERVIGDYDEKLRPKTYLTCAICLEDICAVKLLIKAGADVNNKTQRLPLRWAISTESTEIVSLLIESGADVNGEDIDGEDVMPIIFFAIKIGNKEIIKLLIEAGADLNKRFYKMSCIEFILNLKENVYDQEQ